MTDQPQQAKTSDNSKDHYEDEIDLLFYFRVIWKWKYLIISGSMLSAIIAVIAYFVMPMIYKGVNKAEMVIEAGYVRSSEDSRKTIIRTREHLISDITSGYYDNDILNMLNADEKNIAGHLKFEAKNQGGNKVKVTYINSNAGEGVQILTCLIKVMSNHFSDTVNDCKDEIDLNIRKAKNEIVTLTHNKIMMEKKLIVAKNRLIEIEADINFINSNQIKPNILKSSNNNVQSSILKDDKIIQRWMLLNAYKNEIFSTSVEKESYENHLIHWGYALDSTDHNI